MSGDEARAAEYAGHILQAVERIETYTAGMTERGFFESAITQDAVIRNFEVIGEASRNLLRDCPEFVAAHSELPLNEAYEMRNALTHGYAKVVLGIVWKTLCNDLPGFRRQIEGVFNMSILGSEADAAVARWKAEYQHVRRLSPEEQKQKAIADWLSYREAERVRAAEQSKERGIEGGTSQKSGDERPRDKGSEDDFG